jgi:cytochrome c-type biogenesis protein CcmH/NrfF
MRGPIPPPVARPRERCENQACVERHREADTIMLWAIGVSTIVFLALMLAAGVRMRARAAAAARKQQAIHDRAQDDLEKLFDARRPEDGDS